MNGDFILGKLQPFEGKTNVLVYDQDTKDIVRGLIVAHYRYQEEYDNIYQYFLADDLNNTCAKVWRFLKNNVPYYIESEHKQYIKSPAAILCTPSDCKSYALFANGIMDAIRRNTGEDYQVYYRFASYSMFDKSYQHVFAVIRDENAEYWIDPVLSTYNEKKEPYYFMDKKIKTVQPAGRVGALVGLSGVNDSSTNYVSAATNIATQAAAGNYAGAASAALQTVLSAIADVHGQDSAQWKSILSNYSDNIKAITYLDYMMTLPAYTGGNGDSSEARFNQFRENFPNVLTSGTVSSDIANAWNNFWNVMVKSVPGGPDTNLKNSVFTNKNSTPSGYIMNGQISQQGVQAAGSTGLIAANTYKQQIANAPVYTSNAVSNVLSALSPAGAYTIMGVSWIWWALAGGIGIIYLTKKGKR